MVPATVQSNALDPQPTGIENTSIGVSKGIQGKSSSSALVTHLSSWAKKGGNLAQSRKALWVDLFPAPNDPKGAIFHRVSQAGPITYGLSNEEDLADSGT